MARHCPECGATMEGASCASCGYGKTGAGGKKVDPDWWRCTDVKFGARCSKDGSMSHGTLGGGPWYCRDHFQGASKPSALSGPAGGFRALRETLKTIDPEAAAERNAIQDEAA